VLDIPFLPQHKRGAPDFIESARWLLIDYLGARSTIT